MREPQEQSELSHRFYDGIVAECLADGAEKGIRAVDGVRVSRIVNVTERGTTLRLDHDTTTSKDGADTSFAFKFVETPLFPDPTSTVDSAYFRATVENETSIMANLRQYTRDLLVSGGSSQRRSWVMTRWLAGPSVGKQARKYRQDLQQGVSEGNEVTVREARQNLLALIVNVFGTVASLHDLGYTHGDIQPDHLIYDGGHHERQNNLILIDFGLARGRQKQGVPYRGALVHFAAPEVAAEMGSGSTDIAYDALSEVYSVASVAFFLYTGKTTTQYDNAPNGDSVSFEEKLSRIMASSGTWRRDFASAGVASLPALEAVLERCLLPDRSARCLSLSSAYEDLRAIKNET